LNCSVVYTHEMEGRCHDNDAVVVAMGTGTVFELLGLLAFGVHVVVVIFVAVVDMAVVFMVDAVVVAVIADVVVAVVGAVVADTCAVSELAASAVFVID